MLPCVPYGWIGRGSQKGNPLEYVFVPLLLLGFGCIFIASVFNKRYMAIRAELGKPPRKTKTSD